MAQSKLISVIIPTFNEEKNINRLILSIKKQSYKKFEIIVVDDGSIDKTCEIAEKENVRVFRRKHKERSVQRNFGAKNAKGSYLLFLDADMELTKNVLQNCINTFEACDFKALIIPEKTTGESLMAKIRRFEREMYEGDDRIEVARAFEKKIFFEIGGYDEKLTGAEDYDLPYRISKKYKIGRIKEYLLHHEKDLSLFILLKKKYYYAQKSILYADKHPELIKLQGTIFFRKAYLINWRRFLKQPFIGFLFLITRFLTMIAAILGYIKGAGLKKFVEKIYWLFK